MPTTIAMVRADKSATPTSTMVRVLPINSQIPKPIKMVTAPRRKSISPTQRPKPLPVRHPVRVETGDQPELFPAPDQIGDDKEGQGREQHDEEDENA